ncbi:MAG: hypothetical protein NZM28_08505 [Fimbriimonadales bacterium]|nr:hypothetical protein [Fimbriimonadales bacterium]
MQGFIALSLQKIREHFEETEQRRQQAKTYRRDAYVDYEQPLII